MRRTEPSEPWIDRLALECQNTEAAFVHTAKRLLAHEPFERFDSECELT